MLTGMNPQNDTSDILDMLTGKVWCSFEKTQNPTDIAPHRCVFDDGHDGPHDLGCFACGPDVARFVEREG